MRGTAPEVEASRLPHCSSSSSEQEDDSEEEKERPCLRCGGPMGRAGLVLACIVAALVYVSVRAPNPLNGIMGVAAEAIHAGSVVRLAARAALCAGSAISGAPLLMRCDAAARGADPGQPWVVMGNQIQQRGVVDSCLSVSANGNNKSTSGGYNLSFVDCDEGSSDQRFDLPQSGQGVIRAGGVADIALCLSVPEDRGDWKEGDSIELAPCDTGATSQAFILRRSHRPDTFIGVNLGGWLILEGWMWPGQMDRQGIKDEYSFILENGGPSNAHAQELMRDHWDGYLRPEHLDILRRFGMTHVRIPLGYWLLDEVYEESDGFINGSEFYLRRALGWLKERDMQAVLDLHAMPGSQTADESFTGRMVDVSQFFLNSTQNDRGKRAVLALAELVRKYEADASTSGVVVGVGLLNEPTFQHLPATCAFYEEMVPKVRQLLPASIIMLGFMDSPHTQSATWFAEMREKHPDFDNRVVYDVHLYHLYGDNQDPWTKDQDFCKTCCRDAYLLEPMTSRGVPVIIGEYSVATGFNGWADDNFVKTNLQNQLSLWSTTEMVVGSFLWNFRLLVDPFHPVDYSEWSLVNLIEEGFVPPDFVYTVDLSTLCPSVPQVPSQCPDYNGTVVLFCTACTWKTPASSTTSGPPAEASASV